MGSVVQFPDRTKFDVNTAPLTSADILYIAGLDGQMMPVKSSEKATWWGTVGIWYPKKEDKSDIMHCRLSAAFLEHQHAQMFTSDIATASHQTVEDGMPDAMVEDLQKAMVDSFLLDFSDLEKDEDDPA